MIKIPPRAISIIHGYEGLAGCHLDNKYYPYHCEADAEGVMTIGRGHVVQPGENFKYGLTLVEVDKLFCQDIQPRATHVQNLFPHANEFEFAAILAGFYNNEEMWNPGSPVHDLFQQGLKIQACNHLMQWIKAGSPLKSQFGLFRRRATEALCLLTGTVIVSKAPATDINLFARLSKQGVIFTRPKI